MIQTLQPYLKNSVTIYLLVLLGSIFGGGSLIRFYGQTCGLNLFDWTTWGTAFITIGSPYCKGLNWICYTTTSIVEHLWLHLLGLLVTSIVAYLPSGFNPRKAGVYENP